MVASNITREDIKRLYAILGESDDFFRTVSKEKKNRCPWYEGETGVCGKQCVGPSCFKHMIMGLAGHNPPLLEDYLRVKTNAILETGERERSRCLAKEFEDDEPSIGSYEWHAKKSATN